MTQRQSGRRTQHPHAEADRLNGGVAVKCGVALGIDAGESRTDRAQRSFADCAWRKRHIDLVHLPDQPHVGGTLDEDLRTGDSGLRKQRAAFRLQLA